MAGINKPDFPGLLRAGFHVLTIGEVKQICVDPFALSKTRPQLQANLETLVSRFESSGIYCDLWVDGSFVTKKIDPEDITRASGASVCTSVTAVDFSVVVVLVWVEVPPVTVEASVCASAGSSSSRSKHDPPVR